MSNYILENIDTFRAFSLDENLIESYFNEGVYFDLVDLDLDAEAESSSSSSDAYGAQFSLTIKVARLADWSGPVPSDFTWYIYDEELDGESEPGLVVVEGIDAETIEISLAPGRVPDGSTEFSFILNLEHPDLATSRTKFLFRWNKPYSHEVLMVEWVSGRMGRLDEDYKQYLLGWISGFWEAWDAGVDYDVPLNQPFPECFIPFDPFAHSIWALNRELQSLGMLSTMIINPNSVPLSEGNKGLIEGYNFLGVQSSIWSCINSGGQGLYKFYGYNPDYRPFKRGKQGEWDWVRRGKNVNAEGNNAYEVKKSGWEEAKDISFDCRSFALLAAKFLRDQLASVCPKAQVKVLGMSGHYLVHVDLEGDGSEPPTDCCRGKFLYEPFNASVWDNFEEYCNSMSATRICDRLYTPPTDKPPTFYEPGQENSDEDFGNPGWEDDPDEVQRISDQICGCLGDQYGPDSNEAYLQNSCSNEFISSQMGSGPGEQPSLLLPKQVIECKQCVFKWRASWICPDNSWNVTRSPATICMNQEQIEETVFDQWIDTDEGFRPECSKVLYSKNVSDPNVSTTCGRVKNCSAARKVAVMPDSPSTGRPDNCCGAWCTGSKAACDGNFYKDGGCLEGYFSEWQSYSDQFKAGSFQDGKKCSDVVCEDEAPTCECVYEWIAKYDCDSGSWGFLGGETKYCGNPLRPQGQWVIDNVGETPVSECYRIWTVVGDGCSNTQECPGSQLPPPALPTETPSCCGSWCVQELGCDGLLRFTGCDTGSIDDWSDGNEQGSVREFNANKTCEEIKETCDVSPCDLPKTITVTLGNLPNANALGGTTCCGDFYNGQTIVLQRDSVPFRAPSLSAPLEGPYAEEKCVYRHYFCGVPDSTPAALIVEYYGPETPPRTFLRQNGGKQTYQWIVPQTGMCNTEFITEQTLGASDSFSFVATAGNGATASIEPGGDYNFNFGIASGSSCNICCQGAEAVPNEIQATITLYANNSHLTWAGPGENDYVWVEDYREMEIEVVFIKNGNDENLTWSVNLDEEPYRTELWTKISQLITDNPEIPALWEKFYPRTLIVDDNYEDPILTIPPWPSFNGIIPAFAEFTVHLKECDTQQNDAWTGSFIQIKQDEHVYGGINNLIFEETRECGSCHKKCYTLVTSTQPQYFQPGYYDSSTETCDSCQDSPQCRPKPGEYVYFFKDFLDTHPPGTVTGDPVIFKNWKVVIHP